MFDYYPHPYCFDPCTMNGVQFDFINKDVQDNRNI